MLTRSRQAVVVSTAVLLAVGTATVSFTGPTTFSGRVEQPVAPFAGEYMEEAGPVVWGNRVLAVAPPRPDPFAPSAGTILGVSAPDDRWIEIDVSEKKLTAWEGNQKVYEFPVSTARPGYYTVRGKFRVYRKVLSQTYRGGSRARGDYYYLPNVPYSLFFHGDYAIHGAYWHNDFGIKNRSAGCVNVQPDNMKLLYEWAMPALPLGARAFNATVENPGTRVVVHD